MPETAMYVCSNVDCGNMWLDDNGANICPICGAQGKIKPPAPPGGTKIEG